MEEDGGFFNLCSGVVGFSKDLNRFFPYGNMGELKIVLPEEVEQKFRKLAMQRFGYQKGALSKAGQKAVEEWSVMHSDEMDMGSADENPILALRGILKHVKKTSVELQHEAWDGVYENFAKKRKGSQRGV